MKRQNVTACEVGDRPAWPPNFAPNGKPGMAYRQWLVGQVAAAAPWENATTNLKMAAAVTDRVAALLKKVADAENLAAEGDPREPRSPEYVAALEKAVVDALVKADQARVGTPWPPADDTPPTAAHARAAIVGGYVAPEMPPAYHALFYQGDVITEAGPPGIFGCRYRVTQTPHEDGLRDGQSGHLLYAYRLESPPTTHGVAPTWVLPAHDVEDGRFVLVERPRG